MCSGISGAHHLAAATYEVTGGKRTNQKRALRAELCTLLTSALSSGCTVMSHDIPAHLRAAARLGQAKALGQVVIVVVGRNTRELYLADDLGESKCTERWMDSLDIAYSKQQRPILFRSQDEQRHIAMDPWDQKKSLTITPHGQYQPARRTYEHVFRVVEHLGSLPEGVRSTVLMRAEDAGVPIWNWPGERLPYRVEFPDAETPS